MLKSYFSDLGFADPCKIRNPDKSKVNIKTDYDTIKLNPAQKNLENILLKYSYKGGSKKALS